MPSVVLLILFHVFLSAMDPVMLKLSYDSAITKIILYDTSIYKYRKSENNFLCLPFPYHRYWTRLHFQCSAEASFTEQS